MNDKYRILNNKKDPKLVIDGKELYRIKALKNFGEVRDGDIGGWVENYSNLSQEGTCWLFDDAMVYDKAYVFEDAELHHHAIAYGTECNIGGKSIITDNAKIKNSIIYYTSVSGQSFITRSKLYYSNIKLGCVIDKTNLYESIIMNIDLKHCVIGKGAFIANSYDYIKFKFDSMDDIFTFYTTTDEKIRCCINNECKKSYSLKGLCVELKYKYNSLSDEDIERMKHFVKGSLF